MYMYMYTVSYLHVYEHVDVHVKKCTCSVNVQQTAIFDAYTNVQGTQSTITVYSVQCTVRLVMA